MSRTRSLKYQLLLVNIITTGAAILIALALMFTAELRVWKAALVRDMSIKADIIGNQCTAALTFNAPSDAEDILGSLRADVQVAYAAVYTREGKLFAAYRARDVAAEPPRMPPDVGHVFTRDSLELTRPIILHEERIGVLTSRVNLDILRSSLVKYAMISGGALVLALAAASILILRLQRTVSDPIVELVELMRGLSRDKDYAKRAVPCGLEELAYLAESFNEMLTAIQSRDRELERSLLDLQTANKKLEELDRLKSDFISTVSHELRTPITSIKAFVELLMIKPLMSEDRKHRILSSISEESERFVRLINDLLDISRIEAGVMTWRDQEVDIAEVVKSAATGILPLAQQKGIALEDATAGSVGTVRADRDRIMQLVMNLLSNAVKFTPRGGRVSLRAVREPHPARIAVSVSDTGPGIPRMDQERIFDKFHRSGDMLTNTVEGTGLGLAIARQIVEHYGGTIWATSEEGRGSVFTFTLPLDGAGSDGKRTIT